jgi:hypothetical protein
MSYVSLSEDVEKARSDYEHFRKQTMDLLVRAGRPGFDLRAGRKEADHLLDEFCSSLKSALAKAHDLHSVAERLLESPESHVGRTARAFRRERDSLQAEVVRLRAIALAETKQRKALAIKLQKLEKAIERERATELARAKAFKAHRKRPTRAVVVATKKTRSSASAPK